MAKFEIQGPDGKTYEVEAPDIDTAISAISSVSGGAGGSSVDQGNLESFTQGARDLNEGVQDLLVGAQSGVNLTANDELSGVLSGVVLGGMPDESGRISMGNYGTPMADRYAAVRDAERGRLGDAKERSPIAANTGEILGTLPPTVIGGGFAVGTKQGVQQIPRLVGYGSGEGALIGAASSDGGNLVEDTLRGTVVGGASGAAAKPVADLVQRGARATAAPFGGIIDALTGRASQTRANNVLARTMERANMSADEVARTAELAARQGQPEFVTADILGQPGQNALSGVARTPGQGAADIYEFLQSRQANAGDRMGRFLAEGFDANETAAQRTAALTQRRSDDAATNYTAARGNAAPVDVRGALSVIDTRLGQVADAQGTGFQGDGIDAVFQKYRNRLAADRVPSDIDAMELSDFDRVLGVKQDLADDISAAQRAGRNNQARELIGLQRELDAALEASSDGYRVANDTFAQQSRAIDAVDAGGAATGSRVRASDTADQFDRMTPDQQAAFRTGMGDRLIGKVESQPSGADRARPLMTDKAQADIGTVALDPDLLRQRIAREGVMAETRQRAIGGSMTANNEANIEDVMPFDVGMIANALQGRFGAAAMQGAQKGSNVLTGRNEATQQLIARMLLSRDPQAALAPVVQQMRKQGVSNQVIQSIVRQLSHQASNALQ